MDCSPPIIRKYPDAGKDWRQEEKGMTEDEIDGWTASLSQWTWATSGEGEGQGSLACCSQWGCKEFDMTEWLNNNKDWTITMKRLQRNWDNHIIIKLSKVKDFQSSKRNSTYMMEIVKVLVTLLCLTFCDPWTVPCQTPLSMRFFIQEYLSG